MFVAGMRKIPGGLPLLVLAGAISAFGQLGQKPPPALPADAASQAVIEGTVTDQSGRPIEAVHVSLHRWITPNDGSPSHASGAMQTTSTAADGSYRLVVGTPDKPATYPVMLYFNAPPYSTYGETELIYHKAWYGSGKNTTLKLSPGLILTGIDQEMGTTTAFAAMVTDQQGQAIPGVRVAAFQVGDSWSAEAFSKADGTYAVQAKPRSLFKVTYELDGFRKEWYNNESDPSTAQPLGVTENSPRNDIDVTLERRNCSPLSGLADEYELVAGSENAPPIGTRIRVSAGEAGGIDFRVAGPGRAQNGAPGLKLWRNIIQAETPAAARWSC